MFEAFGIVIVLSVLVGVYQAFKDSQEPAEPKKSIEETLENESRLTF